MSEVINRGNFEFVRTFDPELCSLLERFESSMRTDGVASGTAMRQALEKLADGLIRENRYTVLPGIRGGAPDLADKLRYVADEGKLYKFDPELLIHGFRRNDRTVQTQAVQWYDFVRGLGNSCIHEGAKAEYPIVSYENLLEAARLFHGVMCREYDRKKAAGKRKGAAAPAPFDEFKMPIDGRYVMDSHEPADRNFSHCIREFLTCSLNGSGQILSYSIVRVYRRREMDSRLIALRDSDAFTEAAPSVGNLFNGGVRMEEISGYGNENSEFYIIGWSFNGKPEPLTDDTLARMDLGAREKLCADLADILMQLHSAGIYHRNLSCDSVCISENRQGKRIPCIIKMDCAKIVSEDFKTVIANVKKRQQIAQEESLLKYRDPLMEIALEDSPDSTDVKVWENADVYSLGVLFGDILYGQVSGREVKEGGELKSAEEKKLVENPQTLTERKWSERLRLLTELQSSMLESMNPGERPSAAEIAEMLE